MYENVKIEATAFLPCSPRYVWVMHGIGGAGYEMFEDEWFEFYHEHHGDILYQVMQNITNYLVSMIILYLC